MSLFFLGSFEFRLGVRVLYLLIRNVSVRMEVTEDDFLILKGLESSFEKKEYFFFFNRGIFVFFSGC